MYFGKNIQILRKMACMTQETLAEKLNISRQTVSKWELGAVMPEIEKLIEICELFNCTTDQLLRESMDYSNEAYSEIRTVTVEAFRYISYTVISCEPEEDALRHVSRWAKRFHISDPYLIGWDFPQVSQEQRSVYHMRGYGAALLLPDGQTPDDPAIPVQSQRRQNYITITLREKSGEEFTIIPNAYKALLTYMAINGIRQLHDPGILPCYEHEYSDPDGVPFMDIYIAIE